MASAYSSFDEDSNGSDYELSFSDQHSSESDVSSQGQNTEPCKYYNKGHCKNGRACSYLHICKYFVKGNCRYGSKCRLNHSGVGGGSFGKSQAQNHPTSCKKVPKLTDGRCYQWQLDGGNGWKDIENDHILEAQYSLPHTKSIKIYNTPYGAVSIDFKRITVYGKKVKVRRLDDGNTVWVWYCILGRKWVKYGEKSSPTKSSPVQSSDIEKKFQSNPSSSFSFDIGGQTLEIRFRDMCQVGQRRKRKVIRRPLFRQQQRQSVSLPQLNLGSKPKWEFEGDGGRWHIFKSRAGVSIDSDEIEKKYQKNPKDRMNFKVQGQDYQLDFGAMIQTNLKTKKTRKIRRV
ncbi:protein mono-ADP-ribosyltransferase PARP12 isoform X1 [Oryzias melastigma]|uniref:protein mono-ADP-ribosyltransferase PARP12 isoform X1 n=1 Tax=Oryzias melastigma TaxID=30732 RepID=UPI000CF7E07B|nr:protein mono-ADP-ribosyltransferase PARP12 isoform X1 [Oryzias melastigma]